jgi:RNA polymerase primary sigma factor
MNFVDISFEDSPLELLVSSAIPGKPLSAAALLAVAEDAGDELQEAFERLTQMGVPLSVAELPKIHCVGEAAVRLRYEEELAEKGDFLTALEETDPLAVYLQELARIPAQGDEALLAEKLAEKAGEEDPDLWNKLLNLSLHRVVDIAREYVGYGVLLMDLIQEGSMGLWAGMGSYTGGDFGLFRDFRIRQAMAQAVIHQSIAGGLGQKMRQALEDYRAVDERLLAELGRNPTLEEIALELHMQPQEASVVAAMLENARNMPRAKGDVAPEEVPQEEDQAVEDTAYFQQRQRIAELLSGLDEADTRLLTLRYGLEGGKPMNAEEVGRLLGLTPAEVTQREAAALARLRGQG